MSHPRSIIPGVTYLITRRTLRRHLLFRPEAAVNQLIMYALAVSARRYGVQVHALCAMSTHIHVVATDVRGLLPKFLQFFHRLVALGTKVLRAWEGPVWDHEPTSVVHLMTRKAVAEKIAYTLANPVAAGLVRHAHEWPGAKVLVDEIGGEILNLMRPAAYFDRTNPQWPETETLQIMLPPGIEEHAADTFRQEVAAELERVERSALAEKQRDGVPILGVAGAIAASPYERITTFEELRKHNPTFAVGRGSGDAWHHAAAAVRSFRSAYRNALNQWCTGIRSAVFPLGTWWMRVLHAVTVRDIVLAS